MARIDWSKQHTGAEHNIGSITIGTGPHPGCPGCVTEAKDRAADLAMGDLYGCSQPAEGLEDAYPFNADAFARSLPAAMCNEVLEVVSYVYHNERRPPNEIHST